MDNSKKRFEHVAVINGYYLQILNTRELLNKVEIPPQEVKINIRIQNTSSQNISRIVRFAQELGLENLSLYYNSSKVPLRNRISKNAALLTAINESVSGGSLKTLIVGNYFNQCYRHIANSLAPEEIYMIDEGIGTINIAKLREKRSLNFSLQRGLKTLLSELKIHYKNIVLDYRVKHIDHSLTYFTNQHFDVQLPDSILRNNYLFAKNRLKDKPTSDRVIFLGNALVERGMVKETTYLLYLQKVISFYKNKGLKTFYYPHGSENISKFAGINLSLIEADSPIEIFLINSSSFPLKIASFVTTGLVNIKEIFDSKIEVESFEITNSDIIKKNALFSEIYGNYRAQGIPVLTLS